MANSSLGLIAAAAAAALFTVGCSSICGTCCDEAPKCCPSESKCKGMDSCKGCNSCKSKCCPKKTECCN